MTKKNYRSDIDGLRALAIILVILFHANFTSLSGGYIGVDVFFIISGYLITRSVDKEMMANTFSFKTFYLKRIRRIIPVLTFLILMVTIPAYIFLFALDLENFSRTVIHTALSTNNFYLWSNGKSYFVENTELLPLLHTWSLSVEEQFYIIWPPILLLLHRYLNRKKRIILTMILFILGIILSIYLAKTDANMAYFLLPARLFELLFGSLLAMVWHKIPKISKSNNNIISSLGLALIIIPSLLLTKESQFPGINAFYPCLGAVFIIISGKNKETKGLVNSILSLKPFIFIGLISYSLYLWHWPILVFTKYLGYEITKPIALLVILLTMVLSYLSWKYVEQPFRYKFTYNFPKTLKYVFLPSLTICGLIYGVFDEKDGFPKRFPELNEFNKTENFPSSIRKQCFDKYKIGNCDECGLGVKKDTLDGVLIGDSFANHSAAFIDVLAKDAGLFFHDTAAGGYPLLTRLDETTGLPNKDPEYGINRYEYAKKFKAIIIAANWEPFTDPKSKNYQLVIKTLEELLSLEKNIVIIDPLRTTTEMTLHKMKMFKTRNISNIKKEDLLISFYERSSNYIIHEIKRKFPSITIINLNDVMCKDESCGYEINETIIYRNRNHLNTSGATLLGEKYLAEIGNPLMTLKNN